MKCKSCDFEGAESFFEIDEVCRICYRDPKENCCADCGKHLSGIPYEYVCGMCIQKSKKCQLKNNR